MADDQAQANTPQQATATKSKASKTKKQRREPLPVAWRWRVFWMGRSGWRTAWGLVLAIPVLLALIYLALPQNDQEMLIAAAQEVVRVLGATGLRVGIEVALFGCAIVSFALLLAPGYRQYRYLHLPTSVIPHSTYLLDFENMAANPRGDLLLKLMLERLRTEVFPSRESSQRWADLLYFMNARHLTARQISEEAGKGKDTRWVATQKRLNAGYNELYLNGFQFVNSPHKVIPRQDSMKEAVDRAIELFALERALLGGFKQRFVIISGDGDYAPLIYRLVALGHDVEVWMWDKSEVYDEVKKRIPLIVAPLLKPDQNEAPQKSGITKRVPGQVEITQPELKALYAAIYHTMEKYQSLASQGDDRTSLHGKLASYLGQDAKFRQELLAVGYDGKLSRGSWIRCIDAVGAFGDVAPEWAARLQLSLILAAAQALVTTAANPEGLVNTSSVVNALADAVIVGADTRAALTAILAHTKTKTVDVRYLGLCARALGFVEFTWESVAPDIMGYPRLTAVGERLLRDEAGSQPDAPGATS